MAWATTVELTAFLGSAGLSVPTGADLAAAATSAVKAIEAALRRSYVATVGTRKLDGTGTRVIVPPTNINADGSVSSGSLQWVDTVRSMSQSGATVKSYAAAEYRPYPESHVTKEYFALLNGRWPVGLQNIEVAGTWGDGDVVPEGVKRAALILAALDLAFASRMEETGGALSWGIKENSESYSENTLNPLEKQWRTFIEEAINHYKRRDLF